MSAAVNTITSKITSSLDWFVKSAYVFLIFSLMLSKPAPILIGTYGVIVGWALLKLVRGQLLIPRTGVNWQILAIFMTLVLSIVGGGDWHEGVRGLNKWIRAFLIFWASYDFFLIEQNEKRSVVAFVLVFLAACLNGLYQYFSGYDLIFSYPAGFTGSNFIRLTSSFGYFGVFACFLIMTIPIAVIYCFNLFRSKWRMTLLSILLSLGFLNLYLTRSRGAWIAAILMILLFCISQRKKWMLALFAVGVAVILAALPTDLIFHHRTESGIDKTTNHRLVLWGQAIDIWKLHPFTGCGLNAYVKNVQKFDQEGHEVKNYYAHNGYLQHMAETGILGIAALFYFFIQYFMNIAPRRSSRDKIHLKQLMVCLSVAGFLFYMFFDTIFHNLQPFVMLWIFMGWALAIKNRSDFAK